MHKGLLLKLKQSRISVNLLKIAKDFLANRSERVLLNGQASKWFAVHAGALQSSIFGLLLLLIYINGFLKDLSSNLSLFSDDTSLFLVVWDRNLSANALNDELLKIYLKKRVFLKILKIHCGTVQKNTYLTCASDDTF